MQPEERLDVLLSQRQSGNVPTADDGTRSAASTDRIQEREVAESEPTALLGAADRFAVWGASEPSPAFADRLEAELLARFAIRSEKALNGTIPLAAPASDAADGRVVGSTAAPAQPSAVPLGLPRMHRQSTAPVRRLAPSVAATQLPAALLSRAHRPQPHGRMSRLLLSAVAATVLLSVGAGALAAAAASAGPGQPLYGVHRVEQEVWVGLASSHEERVRLHLHYAQEALDAFTAAVMHRSAGQADRDALTTFEQETQAAATEIAGLPVGDARDELAAQLASLNARAEQDLRVALLALDWPLRVEVTTALSQSGASVSHVTQASITGASHDGNYLWTVTVNGAGFSPGAFVLIDGRQMGTVVSRSVTRLVAQLDATQLGDGVHTVGVGNPDGTASIVTGVMSIRATNDHGGSGGNSTGSGGGSSGSGSGGGSGSGSGSGEGSGSGDGGSVGGDHGGSGGSCTPPPPPTPRPTPTPDGGR
jgi:hypothetical protein